MDYLILSGRLLWAAGSSFSFAAVFFITWIAPDSIGAGSVYRLVFVMIVEFIVVHSTGFLGIFSNRSFPKRFRAAMFGGILVIDGMFAAGFSVVYGGVWPLIAFLGLTLSKFPVVVLRPLDEEGHWAVMTNWAAMTALYLACMFSTVLIPVPAFGITPEIIEKMAVSVGGLWGEKPHRVLCFGGLYFMGLGLVAIRNELVMFRQMRRKGMRSGG